MREEFVGMFGGANPRDFDLLDARALQIEAVRRPQIEIGACRRPDRGGSGRRSCRNDRAPPRPLLRPPDSASVRCSAQSPPECPPGASHSCASSRARRLPADALHRPAPARVRHRNHAAHRIVVTGSACSRQSASRAGCRRGRSSWRRLLPASAARGPGALAITTSAL